MRHGNDAIIIERKDVINNNNNEDDDSIYRSRTETCLLSAARSPNSLLLFSSLQTDKTTHQTATLKHSDIYSTTNRGGKKINDDDESARKQSDYKWLEDNLNKLVIIYLNYLRGC